MHVYDYIKTFIFQGKPNQPSSISRYNITVLAKSGVPHECGPPKELDIAPLLRFQRKHQGVQLDLYDGSSIGEGLDSLVSRKNTVWWEYMDKAVSRIMFSGNGNDSQVLILIKPEFKEDWMIPDASSGYEFGGWRWKAMRAWALNLNLEYRDLNYDVAVDEQLR